MWDVFVLCAVERSSDIPYITMAVQVLFVTPVKLWSVESRSRPQHNGAIAVYYNYRRVQK